MPTRERKEREALRKRQRAKVRALMSDPPNHLKHRIGKSSTIADAVDITGTPYNRVGTIFCEAGQLIKHMPPEGLGANQERKDKRKDDALFLKDKYSDFWGKRGMAKVIADFENLNVRTVQKYFKDFP